MTRKKQEYVGMKYGLLLEAIRDVVREKAQKVPVQEGGGAGMKFIGILGGMSPESTAHYYQRIAKQVHELAGGHCAPELMIRSVNFEVYYDLMSKGEWGKIKRKIYREAKKLVDDCRCEYVAIATNTMHKVVDDELFSDVPLVHIADCVANECIAANAQRVALLGTRFTMREDFMKKRLEEHCIEAVVPDEDIDDIDDMIFRELCHGRVSDGSRDFLIDVCVRMATGENPVE